MAITPITIKIQQTIVTGVGLLFIIYSSLVLANASHLYFFVTFVYSFCIITIQLLFTFDLAKQKLT